jgi:hypothetical protein
LQLPQQSFDERMHGDESIEARPTAPALALLESHLAVADNSGISSVIVRPLSIPKLD